MIAALNHNKKCGNTAERQNSEILKSDGNAQTGKSMLMLTNPTSLKAKYIQFCVDSLTALLLEKQSEFCVVQANSM